MSSSPAKTFALTARRYQQSHNGALQSKKVLRNTHRLISTSRVKQHHDQSGKSKVNGELLAMVTLAAASVSLSNESFFDSADKSARCSGIATAVSSGSHDTSHDFLLKKFSVLKGRDNEIFSKLAVKDLSVDIMTPTESKPQLSVKTSSIIKNENDHEVLKSPEPYPHWTLKECMEQPEAIACVLGFGNRLSMDEIILGGLDENITSMSKIMHLTLSACGTSLNAAKYAEKLMKALGSFENVFSVDAAEAEEDDTYSSLKASECGLIVIPDSDMDERNVDQVARAAMLKNVTIMNVASDMNMKSNAIDIDVYSHAGQEKHVTSTNSFSTQVTVLALVALWFRQMRDKMHGISTPSNETRDLKESLMRLPISFGMAKKTRSQCKKIAQRLKEKEHCFILGKGRFMTLVAVRKRVPMYQCVSHNMIPFLMDSQVLRSQLHWKER
mmetsp:Transcript_15366/g.20567  ORF Transcript_15366/g.20567 Transcript_15366/m.20567 type:complete len:442 (-) Transcript_15366:424-1749(-)